jgi:hypothetical protein
VRSIEHSRVDNLRRARADLNLRPRVVAYAFSDTFVLNKAADARAGAVRAIVMGQWEPIAQDDDTDGGRTSDIGPYLATRMERVHVACKVLLMASIGVAIGCVMVVARRVMGMD